ncbi:hypothetical protein MG296_10565 [Flavobacteriaceae bacterium TK19130]|nr:hypothetical protein [Thermobacterium salinum]
MSYEKNIKIKCISDLPTHRTKVFTVTKADEDVFVAEPKAYVSDGTGPDKKMIKELSEGIGLSVSGNVITVTLVGNDYKAYANGSIYIFCYFGEYDKSDVLKCNIIPSFQ